MTEVGNEKNRNQTYFVMACKFTLHFIPVFLKFFWLELNTIITTIRHTGNIFMLLCPPYLGKA